jgi:hypothetical protein
MDDFLFSRSASADPYGDVELGVECAWPSAEWHAAANAEEAPGWDAKCTAQYTVSTGTPNK